MLSLRLLGRLASLAACATLVGLFGSLGCSSSTSNASTEPVDAGPPPTPVSCPARVASKTDPVVIRAFAFDGDTKDAMTGALVEVHRRTDDGIIVMGTTTAEGSVDLSIPSGGKLLDIYIRATAPSSLPDHLPTRVEIQGGQIGAAVQLLIHSTSSLKERAALAGVTYEPGNAVVQVGINECNDGSKATPPIVAARITVSPGSSTQYATGDSVFDPQLMLTSAYGGGTDFGVTPGATTIVTVKDGQSNTYATKTEAGVNLFALFQP